MTRHTIRALPLTLLPLFFAFGCAEKADAPSVAEAPTAQDEEKSRGPEGEETSEPGAIAQGEADDQEPTPAAPDAEIDEPEAPLESGDAWGGSAANKPAPLAGARPAPRRQKAPQKKGYTGRDGEGRGHGRFMPKIEAGLLDGQGEPTDMFFRHYGVNPTVDTAEEPKSTFAVDVDTASYSMARSYLERGHMPAEAAIRVEEVVNAFDYGYEPPTNGPFNIHAEAAPSPNRRGYHVLHLGVKGKEIQKSARKDAHLVFVVDVSGSMDRENRLGLVKKSLRLLVEQLEEGDKVGIVTYGSEAKSLLPPSSAYDKAKILRVIDSLTTEGATNAEAGLRMGYQMASKSFRPGAVNRVVLLSDGVANVGLTGPEGLLSNIVKESKRGITLSTVGVGMGNYNDTLMEQLANKGNGNYHYVDKLAQARKVFVEQLTGTLEVIAKDVKIQVDFDPSVVQRYRLIGYENRKLTAREFDDDRVDAGEIGAGHSVTALYEVRIADGAQGRPLGKVRIRLKEPTGSRSAVIVKNLTAAIVKDSAAELSSPSQLSLAAAQFAEKLRGSYWARNVAYEDIEARFGMLAPRLRNRAEVVELKRLVARASELDRRGDKFEGKHGPLARMDFDRVPVLQ